MFEVFKFECRYQLRSPLFLVLALVFFLLAFLLMGSESVQLGGVGNNLNLNAAWVIVYTQFFFSLIGMLAAIAIAAQAITRDYELRTAELFFATGIAPWQFVLGRYLGAALFGVLVCVAALMGTLIASVMPWLDQERLGEFTFSPFVYALFIVTIPNLFFSSALFFAVAALTRSMLAAFIAAVGFLVAYIVISSISDPEQIQLYSIIDPFGSTAFAEVSRYWTVFERNTMLVPVAGNFLINRLLWVTLGIVALLFTVWRYEFSVSPSPFRRRRKASKADLPPVPASMVVAQHLGGRASWAQFASQLRMDLAGIYKTLPFYAVLGFAALNVWGGYAAATSAFGTPTLPVTGAMLRAIGSNYLFFVLLIILYFAGEIVHRERQTNVSEVIDATPYPNIVMVLAKICCLWSIVTALLLFALGTAVAVQVSENYFNFEPLLYLKSLFFVQGGFFYLLAVLAVFVQILAGNKWLGMISLLVVILFFQTLPSLGFEHGLYSFGTPNATYSDMNGYGHYWAPLVWFTIYWSLFCVVLLVLSHLLFTRGRVDAFAQRLLLARQRLNTASVSAVAGALFGFAAVGGWIFYNTNVLNTFRSSDDVEALQAGYEKQYKQYELANLPEVTAVDSAVDLYPDERRLESRGAMTLFNKSTDPIDELLISTHPFARVNLLDIPGGELISEQAEVGARRFRLKQPLQPLQQTSLSWNITWHHQGFNNANETAVTRGANNRVVANGTFVNNTEIMPVVGYNADLELGDPNKRREHDLLPIVRLPKIGDVAWLNRSQLGLSERTAFRTVFSTSSDQIAIAPGYQVGEVEERDGRRFYTFEMDEPIWPFFSFVSARYAKAQDAWEDVAIEVYHHPDHTYNIEPMIRGTQKSLNYFTREFSPYQYRQFRILEFPRYATFAQSFPNTIPFSEAIGFVADLRDKDKVDLVFYVTAHELAHQWWGHQVAGAYMQGMTVIVETLAQYSALMVMEQEYGADRMRRFLRAELDRYLLSRGSELIEELPLVRNESQGYIHYQKGSLVMYALQDLIGEDKVNLALRRFLGKYAYGTGPFPTALDLVQEFRAVALPEHQDTITDLFEKITLFDFSIEDTQVKQVDGQYEVTFKTRGKKYYADGEGMETPAQLRSWVDIAIFPEPAEELEDFQLPKPLFFEKRYMTGDPGEFVITVSQRPDKVGIDPYNKLIDRNPEDNLVSLN